MANKSRAQQPTRSQKESKSNSKTQQSRIKTKPSSPSIGAPSTAIATRGAVSNSVPTLNQSKTKPQSEKTADLKSRAVTSVPHNELRGEELVTNIPKSQKRSQKSSRDVQSPPTQGRNVSVSPVPSNQSLYDSHMASQETNDKISLAQDENMWNSRSDWEGMDIVFCTDDDKIRE